MATRVLAYECRFCRALKRTKAMCERHELACTKNPDARNCLLCVHALDSEKPAICALSRKRCSSAVSARCGSFKRREAP